MLKHHNVRPVHLLKNKYTYRFIVYVPNDNCTYHIFKLEPQEVEAVKVFVNEKGLVQYLSVQFSTEVKDEVL